MGLSLTWTKVSGPGTASFGNAHTGHTSVTVGAFGRYVFRLTATDGSATTHDDMVIVFSSQTSSQTNRLNTTNHQQIKQGKF